MLYTVHYTHSQVNANNVDGIAMSLCLSTAEETNTFVIYTVIFKGKSVQPNCVELW